MPADPRKLTLVALLAALMLAGCGGADSVPDDHDHASHESHAHDGHDDDEENHEEGEGHDSHDHEGEGDTVRLTATQAAEAGIQTAVAQPATLSDRIELPAEIRFDQDRVAAVASQVNGTVSRLHAGEGDMVAEGEILATISSRELAGMKADFLTARTREALALAGLERERALYAGEITSMADLQAAEAAFAAAEADREAAENKLHAIGIGHDELDRMHEAADGALALSSVRAPLSGTIIARQATLGASVTAGDGGGDALFRIVDDSVVWADIAVYKADAPLVREGLGVELVSGAGETLAQGEIALVLPVIDESSRTATARVILDNPDGRMRPGQFVSALIRLPAGRSGVVVPDAAIQTVEGRASVFVPVEEGFEPRQVETGQSANGQTEITGGLEIGDAYVSEGAFTLKAQLEKDAFGDGHVH